jgi:hypothetical protein
MAPALVFVLCLSSAVRDQASKRGRSASASLCTHSVTVTATLRLRVFLAGVTTNLEAFVSNVEFPGTTVVLCKGARVCGPGPPT